MKRSGSKILADALVENGVRYVFGIPGTHNIEFFDAMIDHERLSPTLITDEQSAAFMADGVYRASGQLAAICVVPGAGLTHALSGIAEAYLDQVPLLVIMSGIRTDTGRSYQLHDIDQAAVVTPIVKKLFRPQTHADLRQAVDEACKTALASPGGPVAIEVPANLMLLTGEYSQEKPDLSKVLSLQPQALNAVRVDQIALALNESQSVLLYVGAGALNASSLLPELADRLNATVFTTISGKGVFPESHPRWGWSVLGASAPPPLQQLERRFDCMLAIGCRFGEVATGSYGIVEPKKLIHIDIDPSVFDKNYQTEISVCADSGEFVRLLLKSSVLKMRSKQERDAQVAEIKQAHVDVKALQREFSPECTAGVVRPSAFFESLQKIFGAHAVYVTDSGNGTFQAVEHLRLDSPRSFLAPVDYSCMGYSVPAGIGAQLVSPERPVAIIVGVGAFLMTGLELLTAVHLRVGVVVFLLRDRELSQIAQFQRASLKRTTCTDLPDYDASSLARAMGLQFKRVDDEANLDTVIRGACQCSVDGVSTLVEVIIDPGQKTFFSAGVLKTNFRRLPWGERLRLAARMLSRTLNPKMRNET